ncbi:hypothetical protein FACS189430_08040 [Bacteroidia bacterium]|nr:hypothetical protein FACS189430_08040 [Bacteroidia bacterium]
MYFEYGSGSFDFLSLVIRHIRDNITDDLNVDELAALCSLTPDYFIRLFQKEIGCTPLQYIIWLVAEQVQDAT